MRAWLSVLLMALAVPAGAELRAPAIKGRGSVPIYVGVPTLAQVVCGGVTNGSVCGGSGGGSTVDLTAPSTGTDLGAAATPYKRLYLYGAGTFGTTSMLFTGTPTAARTYTFPDANTSIPIFGQTITFAGPTAARTYTLPDAAVTLASLTGSEVFTNKTLTAPTINGTVTTSGLLLPTFDLMNADTTLARSAAGVVSAEGVDLVSVSGSQSLTNKTLVSFELGSAATDTTITRSAAGKVAVEGVDLVDLSSSQTLTNKQMTTIELGAASDTTIARVGAGIISVEGSRIMTFGTESSGQTVTGAWLWGSNQTFNNDFAVNWGSTARRKFSTSMTPDALTDQVGNLSLSIHLIDNNDTFADALNGPCGSALCASAPTYILDPKTPTGAQYLGMAYYGSAGFALKTLTESSATTLVNIPVAASAGTGGELRYCVFASDSTDQQSRCGTVHFAASNKAGTETCAVYGIDTLFTVNPAETQDGSGAGAISSGTLTYAWTSSNSPTNACAFSLNAVSSLTQTTLVARYRVDMTGPGEPAPQ